MNRSLAILTFLILAVIATLFPPYHWGPEQLQTEQERSRFRRQHSSLYDQLPIKRYAFLFGSSSRTFLEWTWDGTRSIQAPIILQRRLIRSELLLEYVLCALAALGAGALVDRRSAKSSRTGF
jgi:hypothetical protein